MLSSQCGVHRNNRRSSSYSDCDQYHSLRLRQYDYDIRKLLLRNLHRYGSVYTRRNKRSDLHPFYAACSSAYSSCQTDVSSCTAALAGGIHGVTISGPNGGVTVSEITATLDPTAASQVCQSLSSQACYGLQVAACAAFGTGTANNAGRNRCGHLYGIGAGVAIGMAGEMLR